MYNMETGFSLTIPTREAFKQAPELNFTRIISSSLEEDEVLAAETDADYEQFLADVWVGVVLTLMVLSCVFCMCSCLLYHKFQQWKRSVIEARTQANLEAGTMESELPSYTIASGLPSYEEALEQLKKVKELTNKDNIVVVTDSNSETWVPHTPPTPLNTLSVVNLFQLYSNKNNSEMNVAKPT